MIDLDLFFDSLKDVAMATKFGKMNYIWQDGIRNGMGYCYLNVRINSVNNVSISCKNFAKFGPVVKELTEFICELMV